MNSAENQRRVNKLQLRQDLKERRLNGIKASAKVNRGTAMH